MGRMGLIALIATGWPAVLWSQTAADANTPTSRPVPLVVADSAQLAEALGEAGPGTEIHLAPGVYRGGVSVADILGRADAPIIVQAADTINPPVFEGMKEAIKLSRCSWITLRGLHFRGCRSNGINVDDGGDESTPSMNIVFEDLSFADIGPSGNHDAIKLSGVRGFIVRNCRFRGWGGSAIDMVGCHNGLVDRCRFEGVAGYRQKNALQIKGGSSYVLAQRCLFLRAGERAVSIGGQTGAAYFRPSSATTEARHVTVAGNRFVGGEAHIAWVTSRQTRVHHNLFYQPEKWIARVLQESTDKRFRRCGAGQFRANVIVTDARVASLVNVGPSTEPDSFHFARNVAHRLGGESPPVGGIAEFSPIRDVELSVETPDSDELRIRSGDPRMEDIGPGGYDPMEVDGPADLAVPPVELDIRDLSGDPAAVGVYVLAAVGLAVLIAATVYAYPLIRARQRRRR